MLQIILRMWLKLKSFAACSFALADFSSFFLREIRRVQNTMPYFVYWPAAGDLCLTIMGGTFVALFLLFCRQVKKGEIRQIKSTSASNNIQASAGPLSGGRGGEPSSRSWNVPNFLVRGGGGRGGGGGEGCPWRMQVCYKHIFEIGHTLTCIHIIYTFFFKSNIVGKSIISPASCINRHHSTNSTFQSNANKYHDGFEEEEIWQIYLFRTLK